jgi:hypothetical protein
MPAEPPAPSSPALLSYSVGNASPPAQPIVVEATTFSAAIDTGTKAAASTLSGLWLAISTLTALLSNGLGQSLQLQFSFLSKAIGMWGGSSPVALQLLLERVQLVGTGIHVAPPQMSAYRQQVLQYAWASMRWTREWLHWPGSWSIVVCWSIVCSVLLC